MNREPSAASLLAEGLSRTDDGIGIALLVLLGWRMFFAFDSALQERALLVGFAGMLACWLDRASLKNARQPCWRTWPSPCSVRAAGKCGSASARNLRYSVRPRRSARMNSDPG